MSDEQIQKNIRQMEKQLKQLGIDIKNAENDKTAPANDRFAEVLKISFPVIISFKLVTLLLRANTNVTQSIKGYVLDRTAYKTT